METKSKSAVNMPKMNSLDSDPEMKKMKINIPFSKLELLEKYHVGNSYDDEKVVIVDQNSELEIHHFTTCTINSLQEIKNSRGIIKTKHGNVVCKTFNFVPELLETDKDEIKKQLEDFSNLKFYVAEEGSLVRLFFFKNKWHLSTHRKISAFNSRWGSEEDAESFGEMFVNCLVHELGGKLKNLEVESSDDIFDVYCHTLDTKKIYTYLIRCNEFNRIVCDAVVDPTMYFTGSFETQTFSLLNTNDSLFDYPKELKFSNVEELVKYVSEVDPRKMQGVMAYLPNGNQVKIVNSMYNKFSLVRGNEPNILARYLQVREDFEMFQDMHLLYPLYSPKFEEIENILENISYQIHKNYVNRYINHNYVNVPQPEYFILQKAHEWHLQDRYNNRVYLEKIKELVYNSEHHFLLKLIKSYLE